MSFHTDERQKQSNTAPRRPGLMLQRKCACGQHTGGGECTTCKKKERRPERLRLQRRAMNEADPLASLSSLGQPIHSEAGLPGGLGFGHDFSHAPTQTPEGGRPPLPALRTQTSIQRQTETAPSVSEQAPPVQETTPTPAPADL